MWKRYDEAGKAIVGALARLGEAATHDGPGPSFYPNLIRSHDGIEVRFSVSEDHLHVTRVYVETPDRVATDWDVADWGDVGGRVLRFFVRVREERTARAAQERAAEAARLLNERYGFDGDGPFRMVATGAKVCLALDPVEADEAQVLALLAAARASGLVGTPRTRTSPNLRSTPRPWRRPAPGE